MDSIWEKHDMAEECGCKPDYTFVGHGEDATEVIYCPLHKAAPEMLAALKRIGIEKCSCHQFDDGDECSHEIALSTLGLTRQELLADIAQAETGAAPPAPDKLCVFCKKPMGDESAPPNAAFGLHRRCK